MNLDDLIEAARALPEGAPLIFSTPDGPISEGYHVTELKLAHINSIDCAAQLDAWTEATLQILDGHGRTHLPVGKFIRILDQSVHSIKGLGSSPLRIEFAHDNNGMQIFEPTVPLYADGVVQLEMKPIHAQCKPAMITRSGQRKISTVEEGCCGGPAPEDVDACCVKDADAKAAGEFGCGCGGNTAPSQ